MTVVKVHIRERSWLAKLAARRLGYQQIAMVVGRTIYLHNSSRSSFLQNRRWLIHELKHVEQWQQHGYPGFLWKYLREYMRNGYYYNKYEVEARNAEHDVGLLKKFEVDEQ